MELKRFRVRFREDCHNNINLNGNLRMVKTRATAIAKKTNATTIVISNHRNETIATRKKLADRSAWGKWTDIIQGAKMDTRKKAWDNRRRPGTNGRTNQEHLAQKRIRSEIAKKAWVTRRANAQKNLTNNRSEIAKKAWDTRRNNQKEHSLKQAAVKHYFVVYVCDKAGSPDCRTISRQQLLRDMHPLEWQKQCNEKYGHKAYIVLSWQEISEQEFQNFQGSICQQQQDIVVFNISR